MKVLKFGGSSLATPDRIRDVSNIVLRSAKKERVIVVVSAFQGVTDRLLEAARLAENGGGTHVRLFDQIAKRHRDALSVLHAKRPPAPVRDSIDRQLAELRDALHGINLLRYCPPRALDLVASFGERLSAEILSSYVHRSTAAQYVDARSFVVTDDQFTGAAVQFNESNRKIRKYFAPLLRGNAKRFIPIITGFIGSTEDGRTTTIGRNGSDYTASIIGAALGASQIEIWTDVDGILSADPSAVRSAFVIPRMSYEEAMELSYFGAKVLHSATIAPAVAQKIPVLIKNTLNPGAPGTLISDRPASWKPVAKGISSVENITLLTLRGLSMVGVPGTAERLFRALALHRVNVILISQASSEHTICFATQTADAVRARKAIHQEFRYEFQNKITVLDETPQQTVVAIVGDGMKGTPGVAGKVFQSLGRNNVNLSAIAQGASERNISFVIDSHQRVRALNVVHQAFFESFKRLKLVILGVGNIGSTLLKQLEKQRAHLLSQGFVVDVCGISDSKTYLLSDEALDLRRWRDALRGSNVRLDLTSCAQRISEFQWTNAALVDCTASVDVVRAYPQFVNANMHIITPNKKANVLPRKQYASLMSLMKLRQKHFLYEANVGAGLPIISTLRDLISSGDDVIRIEGMFSGTLSYLFNTYDGSMPFSSLVRQAHGLGFTEPDPRDDLSGADVARKLLILARQLEMDMDLDDIKAETLVPPTLRAGKFSDRFYGEFSRFDKRFEERFQRARRGGKVLRYVGSLTRAGASASIAEFPGSHPFASTKGSDNIIAFTTKRYSNTPLIVQGPGAGADVTAMGVFSDILKLLHYLPS